jgi:hypothetical protein
MAGATHSNTHHQGTVQDPEHDGRLKENREAGRTKGTTPGSEARAHEHGHESQGGSHSGSHSASHRGDDKREGSSGGSHSSSSHQAGGQSHPSEDSDDLKSREYKDEQGDVHHHTRTYMEQHKDEKSSG